MFFERQGFLEAENPHGFGNTQISRERIWRSYLIIYDNFLRILKKFQISNLTKLKKKISQCFEIFGTFQTAQNFQNETIIHPYSRIELQFFLNVVEYSGRILYSFGMLWKYSKGAEIDIKNF